MPEERHRSSPGLLLALIGQLAMRRLREAHTAHHLNPRQVQLLALLDDRGATAQGELGQIMNVDPSILVTLLNPLEADDMVLRERDPGDRRRHVVTLTAAGREALSTAAAAQCEAEAELFGALDPEQREQLRNLLLVLRDSLAPEPEQGCPTQIEEC